ncbi:type II toxin-antitoxin system ParD family antitoxin [Methylobacterium sp. OT2]|uniref:type II toxin-antitoxin system ParD family antitoxin n=1 Tax=Methylobacterium sp. OT2 TaxID=2813779 RepID=UPI00197B2B3D|nr:type II toxin-antitoxin system ParD family antitoxin [Methylobacterium sp. OT2]MBN4092684.1 type II toxin-antitoxin system ParD family antitoxin [Methylobacterium sp. OT2]
MPAKHSRHIALTGPLAEWVDSQVSEGEYTSVSDLIRTAIRLLREQEQKRRAGAVAIPSATADNRV